MDAGLRKAMLDWVPMITAVILVIVGFIHGRFHCLGTPRQKTISNFVVVVSILFSTYLVGMHVWGAVNVPSYAMPVGQIVQQFLLGVPFPLLAGLGLFVWANPDKWYKIARNRKNLDGVDTN